MGGCGISGVMYGKVEACDFLCHPYATDLIMLTVEVLSNNLEARALCPADRTLASCATRTLVRDVEVISNNLGAHALCPRLRFRDRAWRRPQCRCPLLSARRRRHFRPSGSSPPKSRVLIGHCTCFQRSATTD